MVRMSSGGDSKQDYGTPKDFMTAVEKRFGPISFDLAASPENAKASKFFTIEDNALEQDWKKLTGTLWLNPPYKNITPWAKKCWETPQQKGTWHLHRIWKGQILFLVPASVGSNWFRDYVQGYDVTFLNGRLTFEGADDPYPRDCMLVRYYGWDGMTTTTEYDVWDWKNDINR